MNFPCVKLDESEHTQHVDSSLAGIDIIRLDGKFELLRIN